MRHVQTAGQFSVSQHPAAPLPRPCLLWCERELTLWIPDSPGFNLGTSNCYLANIIAFGTQITSIVK